MGYIALIPLHNLNVIRLYSSRPTGNLLTIEIPFEKSYEQPEGHTFLFRMPSVSY